MDHENEFSPGPVQPKLRIKTIDTTGITACHSKLFAVTAQDRSHVSLLVGSANMSFNGQGWARKADGSTACNISLEQGSKFDIPVDADVLDKFGARCDALQDQLKLQGKWAAHKLDTTFMVLPNFTVEDTIPDGLKK
ncbi:hypothetical protein JCM5296_003628 [Sporobolomyces johnsonii]